MPIFFDDCGCNDGVSADEAEAIMEADMDFLAPACNADEPPCMAGRDFMDWPVAMAYVPMQPWEKAYKSAQGLKAGTIFPSLDLPFLGGMKG